MTDPERNFSNGIGWTFMERTGRYALIIDHGKVTYAEKEDNPKLVTVRIIACFQNLGTIMLTNYSRSLGRMLFWLSYEAYGSE